MLLLTCDTYYMGFTRSPTWADSKGVFLGNTISSIASPSASDPYKVNISKLVSQRGG